MTLSALPPASAASPARGTATLLVASAGCAMTVLDTNVVGIVLPTIARSLNASFADIEWVIGAYVLCFATLLLPAGAIADRYGRRRVFLAGIAAFALASLACGLAPSAPALYLARAAQGAGAAFLLAPALAIIGHTFHDAQARNRAWAVWGGIMGLTMVLSPLLGGTINSLLGWRWAFHVNLPACLLLAAAVLARVGESRDPTPRPLDIPGIALFAAAMFSLTWALILGPERGWNSAAVLGRAAAGLVLFAAFARVERRRPHPMLDLALFAARPFVGAVLAMFAYAAAAQVMASLLPLFLQNARGHGALAAGVGMLPFALAMLVFPQIGRLLARRLDSARILALGLGIVALGNLAMAWAARQPGGLPLALGMAVLGAGGGLLNGETQKAIMGTIPRQRTGMGSGISTTARFSGILLGFASLGAILAGGTRAAIAQAMQTAQLPSSREFIERAMAGDLAGAVAGYVSDAAPNATSNATSNAAWNAASDAASNAPAGAAGHAPLHGDAAALLARIARDGYAQGFSHAFLAAAAGAALAALIVHLSMRAANADAASASAR